MSFITGLGCICFLSVFEESPVGSSRWAARMWGLLTGASDKQQGHPVLCPPHQPPEAWLREGEPGSPRRAAGSHLWLDFPNRLAGC